MPPRFFANRDLPAPGPARDFVGYGNRTPRFEWGNGGRVAVQIAVNYEEGSEYSWPMGDEMNDGLGETARDLPRGVRDLCVESTYEYGSRVGVWRLLRLFANGGVPTTWFAAAVALEKNPGAARALVEAGHEPCSHGYRWAEHFLMSPDEEREAIRRAVASFEQMCGQRPVGWYCRYCPSVRTRELLVEEGGFLYDADAYNDDLPYYVTVLGRPHLVVPYCLDANDSRFVRGTGFGSGSEFFDYLKSSYDFLDREAKETGTARLLSIGLHPRLIGRPGRADGLARFVDYVAGQRTGWLARRVDIARFWLERFPPS